MNKAELEIQQIQFLEDIYKTTLVVQSNEAIGILKEIRNYSMSDAEYALGEFGVRLKFFSGMIDLEHPDLNQIFGGRLIGMTDGCFSRETVDLLKIIKFIHDSGLSDIHAKLLRETFRHHPEVPELLRIDSPTVNQEFIRLIGIREVRDAIRHTGNACRIQFQDNFCKESIWDKSSTDLRKFGRWKNPFEKDVEEAERKRSNFVSHGMTSMAAEIKRTIDDIQNMVIEGSCFGFNRIDESLIAMPLAKIAGYELAECKNQNVSIYVTKETFSGYNFFDEDYISGSLFRSIRYLPKLYGYRDLGEIPPATAKLIDFLESFPTQSNKALFDDFRVMVPGIDYPSERQNDGNFRFKNPHGESVKYHSIEDARKAFDATLVAQGYIPAVLLGMRDNQFYFISYWM